MIPPSLRALLDDTDGQRECEWADRRVWLAREAWGELAVCLQGAQVLHFLPASDATPAEGSLPYAPTPVRAGAPVAMGEGEEALVPGGWLWVTPTPQALPGAIRGGIPLCWPWFADERGADESPDRSGPMHGPARKAQWRLEAADEHEGGVELHLSPTERLHSQLVPRAVIQANARRLHVELITEHVGETPVKLSGALHSYLAVADSFACRVEGLAGARYLDKLAGFAEREQQGELAVRGGLDRIYHSNAEAVLDDGDRRLRIARQGSDSVVVWHPGETPPDDTPVVAARHFLCVESANTRLDPVWLVPGAQHLLGTTLTCEAGS
ncbi:D-hexose-6-phosphate mutarotase [Halomonas sp. MCCC 1A17488]|uniref:aldose epimerase family protein n=1 Tax=unclassified Halomonas TaxID=2609666 RepID=UPI0018D25E0F|nr:MULTISPECIES: D-hexose-6-phosphate mutarotase [unclassified Halomonas]MCE8018084.1 D-hexose-6-phosphate mutarotase [Halomonas sp. MCCC 1A17488]MCG3241417.1 D-hexose-6-phosphate mutarotase [Halomonas sp. MCCC 1A17488]QPP48622.1 D-hexose-6-phosphate mutarotase [Halomonas sp. SS10-MC5]